MKRVAGQASAKSAMALEKTRMELLVSLAAEMAFAWIAMEQAKPKRKMKETPLMIKWILPPIFILLWLYCTVQLWTQGLSSEPNGVVIAAVVAIPLALLSGGAILAVMILIGLLLERTR